MPSPLLIGALLGLAKNEFIDKPKEEKQRELAAKTALYSPFTGLKPQLPEDSNALGSAFQGAALGSLFNQGGGNQVAGNLQGPQINPASNAAATGLNTDQDLLRQLFAAQGQTGIA